MTPGRQTRKLAELRAKTDRQLVEYLSAQLDRALAWAEAGKCLLRAEEVHQEVRRLLPLASHVSDRDWRSLISRVDRLRQLLDDSRAFAYQLSAAG